MSTATEVQAWLLTHQPTRCPTVALCPTTGMPPTPDIESMRKRDRVVEVPIRRRGTKMRSMVGERFGHLIVVSFSGKRGGGYWWRCRCECGNEKDILRQNLRAGQISCGCARMGKWK